MKFDGKFIEHLKSALLEKLPGEEAQYRMAPSYRPKLSKEEILSNKPRVGGVLLLLYFKQQQLNIVFTKRKEYNGVHSAQMSFPGGKVEKADVDIVQTALRETREEVGIEPDKIAVLGRLTELYIPPSNFLVYPVVGFCNEIEKFNAQKEEVAEIVEIPLDFFIDNGSVNMETEISLFGGMKVKVPAYIYKNYVIWGATAIILSEFTAIAEGIVKPSGIK